ncbi:TSUP family transporter [Tsuneonella sp. HG222]
MLLGLEPWQLALALVAALVAGFVRGLAGFGLALLLVPVLALVLAPGEAVVTGNWLGLFVGLAGLRATAAAAEKSALVISGAALVAIPFGVFALAAISPGIARLLIAAIAIGAFAAVLVPPKAEGVPGRAATLATGAASGLLTGFAAMPGPPVIPYYLRRSVQPSAARASMMVVFLVTQGAAVGIALILQLATWREFALALALYPAVWLGNAAGSHAFGSVEATAWRTIAATVLGGSALGAVWKLAAA